MSQVSSALSLGEVPNDVSIGMNDYQRVTLSTDQMGDNLGMPILGLFGEVGSLLSELKKKRRDRAAYNNYDSAVVEELGDVLWYFTNIASRVGLDLSVLAQRMFRSLDDWDQVESHEFGTFDDIQSIRDASAPDEFEKALVNLAGKVGDLVTDFGLGAFVGNRDRLSGHLVDIFRALLAAADAGNVSVNEAARRNLEKINSRWPKEKVYQALMDEGLPENEKLPRRFEIFIEELEVNGRSYVIQKRNGVIIGDRLTDNKTEKDDYRFHDVFHIAYAVFLGWSPVLRALFHLKRKSLPDVDENQDGARAILIEEGVSTFIFGRGLDLALFEGMDRVDYALLKSIKEFVRGFEVERCALWQWEEAILEGFRIFRELKQHRRGYVVADLETRKLEFRPVAESANAN